MAELGMDVQMMAPYPNRIKNVATTFATDVNGVLREFMSVKWTGTDAGNFHRDFGDQVKTLVNQVQQAMDAYGDQLKHQIEEQIQASGGNFTASPATGAMAARG